MDFGVTEGIAAASLALGAVSTGVSIAGQMASADAQSKQAAYQAQVAKNNQIIAAQNAAAATQAGQAAVEQQGLKDRAQQQLLLAAQAASGVDVNSGSSVDTRISQQETGIQDVATTEHNAFLQAYGYQTQATGYGAQSGLYGQEAANATALAPLQAGGTALSGLSSLGTKYTQFVQSGALTNPSAGSNVDNTSTLLDG